MPLRRRLAGHAFVVALVALTIVGNVPAAQGFVRRVIAGTCAMPLGPSRGVWLGVNHDWGAGTLAQYTDRLGRHPAFAGNYLSLPLGINDKAYLDGAASQVQLNRGVLLMTVEPKQGLGAIRDTDINALVAMAKSYNAMGVPVIIRFAHEMNGAWYPWAQDPVAYIAMFRNVANAVHAGAKCTAMAWAPNYGGGYPFTGGQYAAPAGSDRAKALDTNGDGALTKLDDAYAPYYPGDEYVDWVGVSLAHWGTTYPWGANLVAETGKFAGMLTGNYNGAGGDQRYVADLNAFAVAHRKPLGVFETTAFYAPANGGASALDVKRAWWKQVFADGVTKQFPQVRLIGWFEWDKYENDANTRVDWTATNDPVVRDAYRTDLPGWGVFA